MFVWWQALSGAVQVALVIALSSTVLPQTAYAFYAWSVIIHTFIQIPGFYQVIRHALNGFQRQDYARFLDICLNILMPILVQPIFVTIMFVWGRSNPVFGGSLGGLFGLGIAAYAAELFTFLVGLWFYRRIGLNLRVLFLAHFDWEVIKTSFKFGVFEMLGSVAWAIGQAGEIAITQFRLVNYGEIWGNWGLAQNFIFAFNVLQTLYDGVMPAISEAISTGRRAPSVAGGFFASAATTGMRPCSSSACIFSMAVLSTRGNTASTLPSLVPTSSCPHLSWSRRHLAISPKPSCSQIRELDSGITGCTSAVTMRRASAAV